MGLNNEQRLQIAQIAKEITLQFAGKLHLDTSTSESINRSLTENVSDFYVKTFNTILNVVEEK